MGVRAGLTKPTEASVGLIVGLELSDDPQDYKTQQEQ